MYPFGLTNAPAIFQWLMQRVLDGVNPEDDPDFTDAYIEDVLVFSRTAEDHVEHLRVVLDRLCKAGLKLKPKKCHFVHQSIEYLGYMITPEGLLPNPHLTEAVSSILVPTNVTEVRQFLGLASHYHRFVKNFAKIASPLHGLTRTSAEFEWTQECQAAFDQLKNKLETPFKAWAPSCHRSSNMDWCTQWLMPATHYYQQSETTAFLSWRLSL